MNRLLFLIGGLVITGRVLANFEGSDDFNHNFRNSSLWGTEAYLQGRFIERNDRLEYSASSWPSESFLPWVGSTGDFTRAWAVQIDYFNAVPISTGGSAGVSFQIANSANRGSALSFGAYRDATGMHFSGRLSFGAQYSPVQNLAVAGGGSGTIRIEFDPVTKVLSTLYAINTSVSPEFVLVGSYGVAGGGGSVGNFDWGMAGGGDFELTLIASSNFASVPEGLLNADNFVAVPEASTTAFVLGGVAVLATFRRRTFWPVPHSKERH